MMIIFLPGHNRGGAKALQGEQGPETSLLTLSPKTSFSSGFSQGSLPKLSKKKGSPPIISLVLKI